MGKLEINNTYNTHNTINNVNINLLNYNDTDTSHLTDSDYEKCIKQVYNCVMKMIERVHFNPEKPENPIPVTPQPTPQKEPETVPSAVDAAPSPKAVKPPKPSLLLTKVETPPDLATPVGSEHIIALPVMDAGVTVEKSPPVEPSGVPAHLTIETEPAVHFTPYDTVFQDTSGQSTIEYAPKVSVEDKPPSTWGLDEDVGPTLTIHESSSAIGGDEVEDLEAPPVAKEPVVAEAAEEAEAEVADIDVPLASTSDFEELS
jgi:hypothetical protein